MVGQHIQSTLTSSSFCPLQMWLCTNWGLPSYNSYSLAGPGPYKESILMVYEGIKKNRVQFRIGDDFDLVTLISHPKYYALHITRTPDAETPIDEVCSSTRLMVESILRKVTSQMNYSFHADYQLAFECLTHPGREHLCVVNKRQSSPRFMNCLENEKNPTPLKMQNLQLVWFKKVLVLKEMHFINSLYIFRFHSRMRPLIQATS